MIRYVTKRERKVAKARALKIVRDCPNIKLIQN